MCKEESHVLDVIPEEDQAWCVLHTRPRCEKKLVQFCEEHRIQTYLPLKKSVHHYGMRKRSFLVPLFTGYTFCISDASNRFQLRQNRYVANLLEVYDPETLVAQLKQIRRALESEDMLTVSPYLEKGCRVLINKGPLKGVEGIIKVVKRKEKIVLNVDMIQQAVVIEIDHSYLVVA
ncbi:MAG: hypothetical protein GKR87_16365 [Kiritimatiellae bacterium]|nr:hypothetical protein [Kiritimatiellia bacterium]